MRFWLLDMSWHFSLTISHLTCFFNICAHLTHSLILEVARFKCHVFLFLVHGINIIILLNAQLLLGVPPSKPKKKEKKNQFMFDWRNDIFFCALAKWEPLCLVCYNVTPWAPPRVEWIWQVIHILISCYSHLGIHWFFLENVTEAYALCQGTHDYGAAAMRYWGTMRCDVAVIQSASWLRTQSP